MKSIMPLLIVAIGVSSPLSGAAESSILINTFTNPAPAAGDGFSTAITGLGSDRVLISAPYFAMDQIAVGVVYMFHTNGTLLTTFTNPNPSSVSNMDLFSPQFGCATATLGSDLVMIGAPLDRKVCLFTTNGDLVATINGFPNLDNYSFGAALATLGNDKVLIGEPRTWVDSENDFEMGAAYLYSTNGALLTTFYNPDPDTVMHFGSSLAAFGNDRVLIGSRSIGPGAAYVFSTNGALLTTITNPAPGGDAYFGLSVAAVGTDRILVNAFGDDTLGNGVASVYVFNTNGTLLNPITSPPSAYGVFASSAQMVVLGKNRVVIAAPRDYTTGVDSGSAYVFDLNGTLLATINNPTPAVYDYFGWTLTTVGDNGVVIGAPYDDTGATNSGSVYLFSLPSEPAAPLLSIHLTASNTVAVSWPSPSTGFVLQQNTNGASSMNWSNVTDAILDDGTIKTLFVNPTNSSRLYRLIHP